MSEREMTLIIRVLVKKVIGRITIGDSLKAGIYAEMAAHYAFETHPELR